jgi:hypothetical protein
MSEQDCPIVASNESTTTFDRTASTLTAFFIPNIEDEKWTWWAGQSQLRQPQVPSTGAGVRVGHAGLV